MTICPSWRPPPIRPSSPTSIYWRHYKSGMISSPPKGAGYRTTGWILLCRPYTEQEIEVIFLKARMGKSLTEQEVRKYRSALLYELAAMDARSGWVQQFHIGANRNNNKRMFKLLGPDTGFDAIDDQPISVSMNRFFSRLDQEGLLAKTIVYNLTPATPS